MDGRSERRAERPRLRRWRWVAGIGVFLACLGALVLTGDGSGSLDLAAPNPVWVLRLTSTAPTEYEALIRVGKRVRRVRGTTPAEWRLGRERVLAQIRAIDPQHRLDLTCTRKDGGAVTGSYPIGAPDQALTFVCTVGRLGVPRVGAWGVTGERWGARERFRKPWTLWPEWRAPTEEELRALPESEPWPSGAGQGIPPRE